MAWDMGSGLKGAGRYTDVSFLYTIYILPSEVPNKQYAEMITDNIKTQTAPYIEEEEVKEDNDEDEDDDDDGDEDYKKYYDDDTYDDDDKSGGVSAGALIGSNFAAFIIGSILTLVVVKCMQNRSRPPIVIM